MDGVRRGEEWNGILLGRRYGIDRSRRVGLCPCMSRYAIAKTKQPDFGRC
ncbi:hypothetical protein [Moorena producens]